MSISPRIIIYPKDVRHLLGKSERTVRTIMARIRVVYGKSRHQPVTVSEFCAYMGLNKEEVQSNLLG
jgi:hypothetical protein